MVQKLLIDADPGIGDAIAVALAACDPNVELMAVTATAGCVSGPIATRNLQAVIEALDPPRWPRIGNCDLPSAAEAREFGGTTVMPQSLHGSSGLGDFQFNVADLHRAHESAKLMVDIVKAEPHEINVITLGPLTNVAIACEKAPDFLRLVRSLVCLGGSVSAGGDVSAVAEFNIYSNPEAARNVLLFPATKTLVPLDVSGRVPLTFEHYDALVKSKSSPLTKLLSGLLPFYFRAHHEHLGQEGVRLHEVVALAAACVPQLFKTQSMSIDVETAGRLTRGMTVFDRRGIQQWQKNIEVATEVDVQGVLDFIGRIAAA